MDIQLLELGNEANKVLVIDQLVPQPESIIGLASHLAPFPDVSSNFYPGMRHLITPQQTEAFEYVTKTCHLIAPYLSTHLGIGGFHIREASFSLVTQTPDKLQPIQCIPHYDTLDHKHFAILHYLHPTNMGGTGFYRHKRTGFERLSEGRYGLYKRALDLDLDRYGEPAKIYMRQSTQAWENIGEVEWLYNRIVVYQGAMFHTGLISEGFEFNSDPKQGRLTGNIFIGSN